MKSESIVLKKEYVIDDEPLMPEERKESSPPRKSDLPLRCEECQISFTLRRNLGKHMFNYHGVEIERTNAAFDEDGEYSCETCGYTLLTRQGLHSHVKAWHPKFPLAKIPGEIKVRPPRKEPLDEDEMY